MILLFTVPNTTRRFRPASTVERCTTLYPRWAPESEARRGDAFCGSTMKDETGKIVLTSVSAMAAEATTFPVDLIKTRLQLSNPTNPYRLTASTILRQQGGVLGLYKGLSPALIRHLFYTPIRIVGYEYFRSSTNLLSDSSSGHVSVFAKALLGGFSGVIAQVVASPADLIKVRMQADGRRHSMNPNIQPRYSGPFDALSKIVNTEGVTGLWKGVVPNIQRAFLVNMGELACYDQAKCYIIQNKISDDNVYAHILASITSGLCATTLSCPADVIKTRMMNQVVSKKGEDMYTNSFDCLVKTVRYEGLRALWKGFFPTWARLGPWQLVFWVSYEKLRQISGLSSF